MSGIYQHKLPSLPSSDEEYIADFNLRKNTRLDYIGALLIGVLEPSADTY